MLGRRRELELQGGGHLEESQTPKEAGLPRAPHRHPRLLVCQPFGAPLLGAHACLAPCHHPVYASCPPDRTSVSEP